MEYDEKPVWEASTPIPEHIDPYRFWFTQEFERAGAESFIVPYLISAENAGDLRKRFDMLDKKLETELYLPEFYRKMYFDNEQRSRPKGPYEMVVMARVSGSADMLVGEIPGVVAASMPIPTIKPGEPPPPKGRPPMATLADFLASGRKIRRIVGLIDSDIAFAHARFRRTPTETRIGWFWDLDANAYGFLGRMMSRQHIDAYLANLSPSGTGEMQLYQAYARDSFIRPWDGLPPPMFGHGTGVLDAALGGEVLNGDDETEIVGIQLPRFAVAQTHGQFLWLYVVMALDLISWLAWEVEMAQGARPETLVNISVGGHGGRHDGYSGLEMAMDARLASGDLQGIFLAAGNSFDQRVHASFRGHQLDTAQQLLWRIQPDDGTSSFLEIWLPDKKDRQLELTIQPPGHAPQIFDPATLTPGYTANFPFDGQVAATLAVQKSPLFAAPHVPPRVSILLSVKSTSLSPPRFAGSARGLPQIVGDWGITLKRGPKLGAEDIVSLWISRDNEILRLPTGARQSFFTEYSPAHARVVNEGTISDMGSGSETTVCAAHWASDRLMTPYSSRGIPKADFPAAPPAVKRDIFPTASQVADESEVHRGTTVAGYFSGSVLTMSGTSVASPQILRLALTGALPAGTSIRDRVAQQAQADEALPVGTNPVKERRRPNDGPADWGHGRLAFRQPGPGQPGSTNYPRRRRDSI